MSQEPGQLVANKYRLERPLARGGMGSVWVARHVELDVDVALKFRRNGDDVDGDSARRFKREARAAARLRGPHIVHIHDYGLHEGTPYIAMELLAGEDLGQLLEREGRLPLPRALHWLRQAAKALRVVHQAGIVHRDIKPSNLFLAEHHGDRLLKMLDFGIAKTPDDGGAGDGGATTSTGLLLGSPAYMSPEQARGNPVDLRSDLWSLAAVLYRMLTGQAPFEGSSSGDILVKLCTEDVAPPSSVAPHLDAGVDAFFRRALARDPAHRFPDVDELATEAARLAGGDPGDILADDPSDGPADDQVSAATAVTRESSPGASTPGRTTPTASIRRSLPTFERTQASHTPAPHGVEPRPWLRAGGGALLLTAGAVALWLSFDRSSAASPPPDAPASPSAADPPAYTTTARDTIGPRPSERPANQHQANEQPANQHAAADAAGRSPAFPSPTASAAGLTGLAPGPAPRTEDAPQGKASVGATPTTTPNTAPSGAPATRRAPTPSGSPQGRAPSDTPTQPADPVFGLPIEEPVPGGDRP